MSAPPPPVRHLWRIVFQNFIKSFRPKQIKGNLMGEDYFGNKYYEIPADPSVGKRKPSRWFEPTEKEAFDSELTAEWEGWLRGRRKDPPTQEELIQNLQIMEMKKINAAALEEKFKEPIDEKALLKEAKGSASFPKYSDYETQPGQEKKNRFN